MSSNGKIGYKVLSGPNTGPTTAAMDLLRSAALWASQLGGPMSQILAPGFARPEKGSGSRRVEPDARVCEETVEACPIREVRGELGVRHLTDNNGAGA